MPPTQYISREELYTLPHSELNDDVLLDLACREINVSAYNMMRSALLRTTGNIYETHLNNMFNMMLQTGRIQPHMRQYLKDVLLGKEVYINDTENMTTAVLIA